MLGDQVPHKIPHIGLGLKSNEIVLDEERQQPLMVGQYGNDLRRRKRHMEGEVDAVGVATLTQLLSAIGIK